MEIPVELIGKVTKAICGTLLGARLFYDKLKGILIEMGFKMNDYDDCTFNQMIDWKQCTIRFRVDDLKLSHMKLGVLNKIVDDLNDILGVTGNY